MPSMSQPDSSTAAMFQQGLAFPEAHRSSTSWSTSGPASTTGAEGNGGGTFVIQLIRIPGNCLRRLLKVILYEV